MDGRTRRGGAALALAGVLVLTSAQGQAGAPVDAVVSEDAEHQPLESLEPAPVAEAPTPTPEEIALLQAPDPPLPAPLLVVEETSPDDVSDEPRTLTSGEAAAMVLTVRCPHGEQECVVIRTVSDPSEVAAVLEGLAP